LRVSKLIGIVIGQLLNLITNIICRRYLVLYPNGKHIMLFRAMVQIAAVRVFEVLSNLGSIICRCFQRSNTQKAKGPIFLSRPLYIYMVNLIFSRRTILNRKCNSHYIYKHFVYFLYIGSNIQF